jgi:hypothetical protein
MQSACAVCIRELSGLGYNMALDRNIVLTVLAGKGRVLLRACMPWICMDNGGLS